MEFVILIVLAIISFFVLVTVQVISDIIQKGDFQRGYNKGLEDGKNQRLLEFTDGTRKWGNPNDYDKSTYTIVSK